ncbi:hypothetical protein GALL_510390 [mine drainage metagenome]|uniref:Uncharacterized protein n=1 Tax=mine drainage metagenome TaxID=410659 RepID=A0A1J5PUZ8_9ZZZZ
MPLVDIAIVQTVVVAGRVHPLTAALALSTSRMDLDGDALPDPVFIDAGPQRRNRAHIFMARREILVVGQAALDHRRRTMMDDLKIRCANRNRIDANQNLGPLGHRNGFRCQGQLTGIAQHPGAHRFGNGKIRRDLDIVGLVHRRLLGVF